MQSITKKSHELTLADRLSRLNFRQVCKLLGEGGEQLIQRGGRYDIDIAEQVTFNEDRFQLRFPTTTGNGHGPASVEVLIRPAADHRDYLHWECTACQIACEHVGAAFALILEDKMALGLAAAPPERVPIESLGDEQLIAQALQERMERAASEKMVLRSTDANVLWTDYTVTSALSGKTYRLALRGWERGQSFCSCPDFRKNTLGTCKHILNALAKLKWRFGTDRARAPYVPKHIAVYLQYGKEIELRLSLPPRLNGAPVHRGADSRSSHRRLQGPVAPDSATRTARASRSDLSRRGGIHSTTSVPGEHRSQSRCHPRQSRGASAPQRIAQDGIVALPTGWDCLRRQPGTGDSGGRHGPGQNDPGGERSEERRVGKECRSRWSPDH